MGRAIPTEIKNVSAGSVCFFGNEHVLGQTCQQCCHPNKTTKTKNGRRLKAASAAVIAIAEATVVLVVFLSRPSKYA